MKKGEIIRDSDNYIEKIPSSLIEDTETDISIILKDESNIKNIIDSTLNEIIDNKNIIDQLSFEAFKDAYYCCEAKTTYDMINLYENNPDKTIEEFDIKKWKWWGISVDIKKFSESHWIPTRLMKEALNINFPFEMFSMDDMHAFNQSSDDEKIFAERILYCKDENWQKFWDKLDLFLHDTSRRNELKKYCLLLVNKMKDENKSYLSDIAKYQKHCYTTNKDIFKKEPWLKKQFFSQEHTKKIKDHIKAVILLANLYLHEMKHI
jgi:hypothetical protein